MNVRIRHREIGPGHPTYFIADIAANHDGDLERARLLIRLAKEAGADAAKFQNFRAEAIVSDEGFRLLGSQLAHQAKWKESVVEVYSKASLPFSWTAELRAECDRVGIDYLSTPYDFEAIDHLEPFVPAYKVGSGDIDWLEALERMATKGKPVIVATGAATLEDVQRAVATVRSKTDQVVVMQCNTNYTASDENYDYLNLNVLKTYEVLFPGVVLGLSDHTRALAPVLGAVALGARVIERHFTDDCNREGPDHAFAMTPETWSTMVSETRLLERALGSTEKRIEQNERDSVVVQRRSLRAHRHIAAGEVIERSMIEVLRPATQGAIKPPDVTAVVGKRTQRDIEAGAALRWTDLED